MRRDTSEEGWGFGSRRLALLMTVLAAVALLGLAFVLIGVARQRVPYSVVIPIDGVGASVKVPEREVDVQPAPASVPVPTPVPSAASEPSRTPSGPTPRAYSAPRRPEGGRRTASESVSTPVADTAAAAPSVVPRPTPVPSPVATRREPEPSDAAPEPTAASVSPVRVSDEDRNSVSRVERRDARREAREATDALKDIRPR